MTAQPARSRHRTNPTRPDRTSTGTQSGQTTSPEPGVRPSMRLLGLWLAAIPFVIGVWGGSQTAFEAFKWPFAALGIVLFTVLAWREARRDASRDNGGLPLWQQITDEPFLAGAAMIGAGLLLSAAFSPVPGLGLLISLREGLFLILAVGLFVHRPRPGEVRWVLICIMAAVAAQSALALAQCLFPAALGALTPGIGQRAGRSAIIGTLGNPEYLASWAAPAVAASVVLILGRMMLSRNRIVPAVAGALGLAMIFFSGGRGAVLSLAAGLMIAFLALHTKNASRQSGGRKKNALAAGIALACLIGVIGALALIGLALGHTPGAGTDATTRGMLPQRLVSTFDLHSPSMRHRIGLYTITGAMITRDPLLGAGPGLFPNAFARKQGELAREETGIGFWLLNEVLSGHYTGEAHCDPLQWWAEYGLLPFLGLTLMILRALTGAAIRLRQATRPMDAWLAATWVALLVTFLTMWTSFPLHVPGRALTFWVLLGLLAGAMSSQATHQTGNAAMIEK